MMNQKGPNPKKVNRPKIHKIHTKESRDSEMFLVFFRKIFEVSFNDQRIIINLILKIEIYEETVLPTFLR